MSFRYKLIFAFLIFSFIGSIAYSASYYHSKYQSEKLRADDADKRADSSEAIMTNVQRTVAIMNTVQEANQHAKQQITSESQNAANDIKVAVANDDCSRQLVPVAAANRLRQYANSLRPGTSGADSVKPDF